MTRGNQRDLARAKNAKKQETKKKGVDEKGANAGLTLEQRRERDANKLREKQAQNSAKAAGGGSAGTSGSNEDGGKKS